MYEETVTVTAEDTWCGPITMPSGGLDISLDGDMVGTWRVERSFDGGETWKPFQTLTGPYEGHCNASQGILYRVGVPAGAYTSGTGNGRLYGNDR